MQDLIFDRWTPLDFKRGLGNRLAPNAWMAPQWVGDHARRLEAYKLLSSYMLNASRAYLKDTDEDKRDARREYGDADLIVQTIVDSLIGEDATVVVAEGGTDVDVEWSQRWSDQERVLRKLFAMEEKAVSLGDAVIVVSWDGAKGRPALTVYDPGFYFPDLDSMVGDYPTVVNLAWEYEVLNDQGFNDRFLRRIRYELVETDTPRSLPWNTEPTYFTCLMTDATWKMVDLRTTDVLRLDPEGATYAVNADGFEVRDLDLGIDFIPVVHLPNTIAEEEHYGESSLATVLQILDDIQAADTDLEGAAAVVGFPPLASEGPIEGSDGTTVETYGPGTVFTGKLTAIDTSRSLDALLKYVDALMKRLFVNTRVSEAAAGRLDPSVVSSGVEMRLHFGPMERMINKMRLTREEKYPLIFKFARRYAMLVGDVPASSDEPMITMQAGTFIPSDLANTALMVAAAVNGHIMSRDTAVRLLMEAGSGVEDAVAEVDAIQRGDFEGAAMLQQALGSELEVYKYLGLDPPDDVINPPERLPDDPIIDDEDEDVVPS